MTSTINNPAAFLGEGEPDETPAPAPKPAQPKALAEAPIVETGTFVKFVGEALRGIPLALRMYPGEVVRHMGIMVRQNALVILFMMLMLGLVMGLTANFLFGNIGIDTYIAAVNVVAGLRGMIQVVFGWIFAAKIGCGIVAEVGAMRISEEIDAMEVMGVRSVPYLVSTRIIAGLVVTPLIFAVGLIVNYAAGYLMNVMLLNTVSPGGFINFLFLFQNPRDLGVAIVWAAVLGVLILTVSSYYGYTAKGGPVGVGKNTAQSMLVNLVAVSIISMMLVQLFYGNAPNAPLAN